jgi:pentose-5-phosphate-3-epimerase/putative flippase GtrA
MVKANFYDILVKFVAKNRYFITYIFFGVLSLLLEVAVRVVLNQNFSFYLADFFALLLGIIFSAFANLKFNFNVPKKKYLRSIIYFFLVSIFSYVSQSNFVAQFPNLLPQNEYLSRVLVSGIFFIFFYFIHLRLTFSKVVKVGFAIHPKSNTAFSEETENAIEYADFIHIDLIDETYNTDNVCNDIVIINSIIEKQKEKNIQIHMMTKNPEKYLNKINIKKVDIFVHLDEMEKLRVNKNLEVDNLGVVLNNPAMKTIELKKIVKDYKKIMVLCIDNPGFSGQKFNIKYYQLLKKLDEVKLHNNEITVDGGVNNNNAKYFSVQKIVSQSYLVNGNNPVIKIFTLKEENRYG